MSAAAATRELNTAREQAVRVMSMLRNCTCSVEAARRWGTPGHELVHVEEEANKALGHIVDVLTSIQFTLDRPVEQWEQAQERDN